MKTVIGLVGERLTGKDQAGEYLRQKHQAFYIRYSHILDEILNVLNQPISRMNEINLGKALRELYQKNVLWDGMQKRISESQADLVVIGSIRLQDEFESVKALGAKMIYVTAPLDLRYERSKQRTEKVGEAEQSMDEFTEIERLWTEKEIPKLGAQCDFKIDNIGTEQELYKKLDDIIEKILKS